MIRKIENVERLKKINAALIGQVERSMDQHGNAFSLFQTAITLENRVRIRTDELQAIMRRLEHTNLALVAAKEAAENANLSKTRFLAAASHDVLQPLNAAHLSISALAGLPTTEEGARLIRQIERSLATMDELLRTLLDISKFDAGVIQPEMAEGSLTQLFQSLRSDFQPLAERRGIKLRFRPTAFTLSTDFKLLRRSLQNMIANAIRHTEAGGILVNARQRALGDVIEVWDTGTGIPEEARPRIFEEFYRGPRALRADGGAGLGLGLAIVRRMMMTLGYSVSFRSEVGSGTVFRIALPPGSLRLVQPEANAVEVGRPRAYGLFGIKALLVDSDPDAVQSLTSRLTGWSCSVRAATTSAQALNALGDEHWTPDVIIADQHLDDGNFGLDTVRAVRNFLGRTVPALVVSANPSAALSAAAKGQGVELMRKPVKPAEMRALLAHLLA